MQNLHFLFYSIQRLNPPTDTVSASPIPPQPPADPADPNSERVSVRSDALFGLHGYADELLEKFHKLVSKSSLKDERTVPLLELMGAIQLIQAGLPNLQDAERMAQLMRIGAVWNVRVQGEIVGTGNIREAMDQAIEKCLPNDPVEARGK
jgi:hypothetical protein